MIEAQHNYTEQPDSELFTMHTHDRYEIFCFLKGEARYYVEGTVYNLRPGDILIMKKAEAHTLLLKSDAPYERIVVYFTADALLGDFQSSMLSFLDERPLGADNRYRASASWQTYLKEIVENPDREVKRLYLTVLLTELQAAKPQTKEEREHKDNLGALITYLNENLDGELSLDSLCRRFYISRSHLTERFKRLTGTTVSEYIRTKRLVMAKMLLQEGVKPTSAAIQCGFREYSSFFYAYKKKYGVSPKEEYNKKSSRS